MDQGPDGNVFGFFYSTWGINFTLMGNSLADSNAPAEAGNGIYGDYAVCEGPQHITGVVHGYVLQREQTCTIHSRPDVSF